ncbi:MAG TPA: condensation domain-containing protein, partial [Opitutaceae bacterium]
ALGGDSIKALRLVADMRARGWRLGLKTVFAHPRLDTQAAQLVAAEASLAERTVEGEIPLLPIQKWFLESHRDSPLHHFNQAVFYRALDRVDAMRLQRAVDALWRRHASLRASFHRDTTGRWRQSMRPASSPAPEIARIDLRALDAAAARERELRWVRELQAGFDLTATPLVKYGWVSAPGGDRVLCLTHHLVSDWVSHRILLEDFAASYAGEKLLPAVTEVDEWVQAGQRWARDRSSRAAALAGWSGVARECAPFAATEPAGRYGEVTTASQVLGAAETARLRSIVAAVPGATVRDALLAAMVTAERAVLGREALAVALEGHGRESLAEAALDVSRTAGWFTSLYPCRVSSDTVSGVRDALALLPDSGKGYDFLRACAEGGEVPAASTSIGLNYLGEFSPGEKGAAFALDGELPEGGIAPEFERDHPREVSAWVFGGELHLLLAFRAESPEARQMAVWIERVRGALEAIAGDPPGTRG